MPGRKPFLELVRHAAARIRSVCILDNAVLSPSLQTALDEVRALGVTVESVGHEQLEALAPGARHQGILTMVEPLPNVSLEEILGRVTERAARLPDSASIVVFLDEIEDPHNVGAILRAADAFGVVGVVMTRDRAAPLSATARKVSAGGSEFVPLARVTNLAHALREARARGIWLVGADVHDGAVPIWDQHLTGALGLVLGAENRGIRRLTGELCDVRAFIPMHGHVESLNVSQAAAVFLATFTGARRPLQTG